MIRNAIKIITMGAGLVLISSVTQAGFNNGATDVLLEEVGQEIVNLGDQQGKRKYRTYRPHIRIRTVDQVGKCKGRC